MRKTLLEVFQRSSDGLPQSEPLVGWNKATRFPHQDGIAEEIAKPPERVAHRGLADAESRCRLRYAAAFHQCVEGKQKVEVKPTKMNVVDAHTEKYQFDSGIVKELI